MHSKIVILFQQISKNMKKTIFALGCLLSLSPAWASTTVSDVVYEDTLKKGSSELVLNGAGIREIFVVDVYAAGLYLPKRTTKASEVIAMPGDKTVRLGLLRDVDAGDFVEALNDGILDNTTEAERKALKSELQSLIDVMNLSGDVKKGDLVDFDYSKAHGTSVSVNGKLIGEKIGGEALYQAVLKIWLGDKAIDSDLKKALLKSS